MVLVAFYIATLVCVAAQNRCGLDWSDANEHCNNTPCETTDASCPDNQRCYADLVKECPPPVQQEPSSAARCNRHAPAPTTTAPAPPEDGDNKGECTMTTFMGYYASWASTRTCHSMAPDEIDPAPYSHLVFSFAKVSSNGSVANFKIVSISYQRRHVFSQGRTMGD